MDLSIVIPVYNEEENVYLLYEKLKETLEKLEKSYEIIFIDDGSKDKSFEILEKIHKKDKKVKVVRFRRNFGKSAALSTGFKYSQGEYVITMDADLQDNPKEIPRFLDEIKKGQDIVVGWKVKRRDPLTKRVPSKIFNKLTSWLTRIKIHDFNCCFKIYKKEVVKNIKVYGELHRYIPALAYWKGYDVSEMPVQHRARKFGQSKYGITRLLKGFFDLITVKFLMDYAKRPLHLFGLMGSFFALIGFLVGLYILYLKYVMHQLVGDRPLLLVSVLLILLGIQLFSMGLIGEMVISTSEESTRDYNIKEKLV